MGASNGMIWAAMASYQPNVFPPLHPLQMSYSDDEDDRETTKPTQSVDVKELGVGS